MCCVLSRVPLFATPWTVARQPPLSMEIFRQKYWSGLPQGSNSHLLCLLHWQVDFLPLRHLGSPLFFRELIRTSTRTQGAVLRISLLPSTHPSIHLPIYPYAYSPMCCTSLVYQALFRGLVHFQVKQNISVILVFMIWMCFLEFRYSNLNQFRGIYSCISC